MNRVLLAAIAMAAIVAGALVLRSTEPPPGDPRAPLRDAKADPNARLSPSAVLAIRPGAPSSAPARPGPAAPRLSPQLREYYEAKAWKAMHDRLRTAAARTAEESYILAEILDRCARVTDRKTGNWIKTGNKDEERKRFLATVSEKDPNAAQRIAAHDRMSSGRCDGFEGVTTTEAELRELLQQAASDPKARARLVEKDVAATLPADGAPVLQPDGTSRLPTITDAQIEALKQAVQSGDPQATIIAGRVFSTTMADLVVRAGPGEQPVDIRAFFDAWSLAACDLGQPCGADSARLLNACATQGNCGAHDLREHLFYFDHSPQQSQRLNEYYGQIMQAARSGDWSYFTFHRGPPARGWVSIFLAR